MYGTCQHKWEARTPWGDDVAPWKHTCLDEAGHTGDHHCGLCGARCAEESDGMAEREMLAMIREGVFG